MAINIPSRDIIQKDTKLINENTIYKVESVVQTLKKETSEQDGIVYNEFIEPKEKISEVSRYIDSIKNSSITNLVTLKTSQLNYNYKQVDYTSGAYQIANAISYSEPIYHQIKIEFPAYSHEKKFSIDTSKFNESSILKTYTLTEGNATFNIAKSGTAWKVNGISSYVESASSPTDGDLPIRNGIVYLGTSSNAYALQETQTIMATSQVNVNDEYSYDLEYNTNENKYTLTLNILVGLIRTDPDTGRAAEQVSNTSNSFECTRPLTMYLLKSLQVTLYGQYITWSIDKNTVSVHKYTDTNTNSISIPETELLQLDSTAENIGSKIIESYSKGREYAEILCTLSNYSSLYAVEVSKDVTGQMQVGRISSLVNVKINGNQYTITLSEHFSKRLYLEIEAVVISSSGNTTVRHSIIIEKNTLVRTQTLTGTILSFNIKSAKYTPSFSFEIGDYVRPYVCKMRLNSNTGIYEKYDAPMSVYLDGTAKVFEVVGINFEYGGVARQRLKLLEIPQDFLAQTIDT